MKNTTIRYFLESKYRKTNNLKPEVVMAEINYGYAIIDEKGKKRHKPLRYSLQVKIHPSKFGLPETNYKFDKEVFSKSNKNNATVRTKMFQFKTVLNELETYYLNKKEVPTPAELKKELNKRLRNEILKEPETTILTYFNEKIQKDTENSGKSKKDSKSLNTIKTTQTVAHLIEKYQIATNEVLIFETFDKTKYWKFWDTLDDILRGKIKVENPNQPKKQRTNEYGYIVSTLRKYQKDLIKTLKEAQKDGYKTPLYIYDDKLILDDSEAQKDFYINDVTLQKIIKSKIIDPNLQLAKDYIIISSLTGMRYESMVPAYTTPIEEYKDKNYNFKYIHSIQNKTKTEVCIPLFKPILDIVEKRGFPKVPTNSTINKHLKELFKQLDISHLVRITKVTYKSNTIETDEPIYDHISTHDSRGTFYSNLYSLNVPNHIIDNITHPDKKPKNAMAKIYNKTEMINKAKMFVDELNKVESKVYTF